MVAQAPFVTGFADFFSLVIMLQKIGNLFSKVLGALVTNDLFTDIKELFQLRHVLHHVKAAAHRNLEIAEPHLKNALARFMRITA